MLPKKDTSCQKEACNLQACLQARNYDKENCMKFIEALNDCCIRARKILEQFHREKDSELINCGAFGNIH